MITLYRIYQTPDGYWSTWDVLSNEAITRWAHDPQEAVAALPAEYRTNRVMPDERVSQQEKG